MDSFVFIFIVCSCKNNETMGQILLIIGCAAFCILLSGGVSDFIVKPFLQEKDLVMILHLRGV